MNPSRPATARAVLSFLLLGHWLPAAEFLQRWEFNDPVNTALNAVENGVVGGVDWSNGGPRTQNGNLNIGDTPYYKWNATSTAGKKFRTASFTDVTSGEVVFEFVIADWDLQGSEGETNNGIYFTIGDKDDGAMTLEFEVAQSPGTDIRVRSGASNNGSLSGTDAQNQLGGLDLGSSTASVTVQLLANLDTGVWSTRVDAGSDGSFVDLVTDGAGMNSIDRIQLVVEGGSDGWLYGGASGGVAADFVMIDSISLSRPFTLAVDFDVSQIQANSAYENVDYPLDFSSAEAEAPNTTGQKIYAGLELNPVNGLDTGDDDGEGGTYTNGGSLVIGTTGGAKLQWNGAFSSPPVADADLGFYEDGDVATGVYLFKKEDFINGLNVDRPVFMNALNDTLSATIRLDTKENDPDYPLARLDSGKFRWVIEDAGSFYISEEITDLTSDTGDVVVTSEALGLSWFDYDPEISITGISPSAASPAPSLQDIGTIGFWMSTTIAANDGWRRYHNMQCTAFSAEATTTPGPLEITGISYAGPGNDFIINFTGDADTTYKVESSSDLTTPFAPVDGVTATTDSGGVGMATVPSASVGTGRNFFRIAD